MADRSELDALLDSAARECDKLVAELDGRIPNHVVDGKLIHEEHPTEEQIASVVKSYVTAGTLAEWEGKVEAEVRKRMKSKGWTLAAVKA